MQAVLALHLLKKEAQRLGLEQILHRGRSSEIDSTIE
jgi:hypothetical protein